MVDLKTIRQLVKLMRDNDLTELDLEDQGGEKIRLKRGNNSQGSAPYLALPHAAPAAIHAAPPSVSDITAASSGGMMGGLMEVQSPMVGTYYSAPSPDAEAFVTVGSQVSADSVVCIIEAMKVFNEIKAEVTGTVQKVLVENGQAVEFGQPLFLVKP